MSLILTSQKNEVNQKAFDYRNYFTQTMKIPKNSKIALNHCTINRNAFFKFEENKVLAFYHGVEMPSVKVFEMKDMPDSVDGQRSPLLLDAETRINSREINNFVNYPQFVVVERGEYSINQLVENLQHNLNNPNAIYGGDFYRTGTWTVTANYTSSNEFENISFSWQTKETGDIASENPPDDSFIKKYPNNNSITYVSTGGVTGGGAGWNCGEFDRFVNNHKGSCRFDVQANDVICGLSRVTDGENYQSFAFNEYYSNDAVINDCPSGLDYYDYCVSSESGNFKIYTLQCVEDDSGFSISQYRMVEFNYGAALSVDADSYVIFTIDNNDLTITINSGKADNIFNLKLKPICNNTYQLVPKISIKGTTTVLTKNAKFNLLSDTNKPIYPTVNVGGTTDLSECNILWICSNYWNFGGVATGVPTVFTTRDDYLRINYEKFASWLTFECDRDASTVQTLGQEIGIDDMQTKKFFWSYIFTSTLNGGDGGFKYAYKPTVAAKEYTFDAEGTVLIPYNTKHLFYHCNANLDGALGINPRFKKGIEETVGGLQSVLIKGGVNIAMTNNDILYIRIDLGNAYTMNGATASISKIISPILTDIENSGVNQSLGIRTYQPERMYLDLNNSEDLYLNSINVSIVTKGEKFARELAPSTSASFHIMSPE